MLIGCLLQVECKFFWQKFLSDLSIIVFVKPKILPGIEEVHNVLVELTKIITDTST